jgi:hypothetical protein
MVSFEFPHAMMYDDAMPTCTTKCMHVAEIERASCSEGLLCHQHEMTMKMLARQLRKQEEWMKNRERGRERELYMVSSLSLSL